MYGKVFVDTNILLSGKFRYEDYEKVYISIVTLEELDGLKKDETINYKVRKANNARKNSNNVKIELNYSNNIANRFLEHGNDNHILGFAYKICTIDSGVIFLTDDYGLFEKATALEIPCRMFEYDQDESVYTGIKEVWMTNQEHDDLLEGLEFNPYGLSSNEYILINITDRNKKYLYMWNEKYLEDVKIKPITNKYLKKTDLNTKDIKVSPLDLYQKAFIHMLQNDEVKVKITDSPYGCGKSFIMIHWALQMLEKNKFKKMYFVKSDSPPKNRKEYPAIPGGIEQKSDPLLGVIYDTLDEENSEEILAENKKIKIIPIQFATGRSLKNAILYINEAQNFTPSEMEKLLSRIGEGTVVLLDGSSDQVDNKYCLNRNGLGVASSNWKEDYEAAQVNMVEDYRSSISKKVNKMDWSD